MDENTEEKLKLAGLVAIAGLIIIGGAFGSGLFGSDSTPNGEPARATVTFSEDAGEDTVTARLVSVQDADRVEFRAEGTGMWKNGTQNVENIGGSATFQYQGSGTITAIGYLDGESTALQEYSFGVPDASVLVREDESEDTVTVQIANIQQADFIEVNAGTGFNSWEDSQNNYGGETGPEISDIDNVGESTTFSYSEQGTVTVYAYLDGERREIETDTYGEN